VLIKKNLKRPIKKKNQTTWLYMTLYTGVCSNVKKKEWKQHTQHAKVGVENKRNAAIGRLKSLADISAYHVSGRKGTLG
jgi:hypothetical protein